MLSRLLQGKEKVEKRPIWTDYSDPNQRYSGMVDNVRQTLGIERLSGTPLDLEDLTTAFNLVNGPSVYALESEHYLLPETKGMEAIVMDASSGEKNGCVDIVLTKTSEEKPKYSMRIGKFAVLGRRCADVVDTFDSSQYPEIGTWYESLAADLEECKARAISVDQAIEVAQRLQEQDNLPFERNPYRSIFWGSDNKHEVKFDLYNGDILLQVWDKTHWMKPKIAYHKSSEVTSAFLKLAEKNAARQKTKKKSEVEAHMWFGWLKRFL